MHAASAAKLITESLEVTLRVINEVLVSLAQPWCLTWPTWLLAIRAVLYLQDCTCIHHALSAHAVSDPLHVAEDSRCDDLRCD